MMVKRKKGQGTVEYLVLIGGIIVVLVAVAALMTNAVQTGTGTLATTINADMGNLGQP